jgi:hypothetical protein
MSTVEQQPPGIARTDLQKHDLSAPGREVIQNRVEISPEAPLFKHFHPGRRDHLRPRGDAGVPDRRGGAKDRERRRGPDGPAEAVHAVRNVGDGNAAELATYVVEKGKPLITPVA